MGTKRLVAGLVVGGVLVLGGMAAAAEQGEATKAGQATEHRVTLHAVPSERPPAHEEHGQRPHAPFVPIINGRLTAYYYPYPPSYFHQFLSTYGYLPPFGAYSYGPRSGYDPYVFASESYPAERSGRVLVVVAPPDDPAATYYYYDSFPAYYGQPGYFPGGLPSVTVVSPTVPKPEQPTEKEKPAPQVQVPGELEKATFLSALAPMLGGSERVSMDFAVGEVRLHRGDCAEAVQSLQRAVADAPDDPTPKLALGLAQAGAGDYEGAAQVMKRALRGMADWRGLKLAPERVFGSEAAYGKVLAGLEGAGKADRDARFVLGFLYLAGGRYADAAAQFGQAGTGDPLVASLLQEAQRREEAAKTQAAEPPPGAE